MYPGQQQYPGQQGPYQQGQQGPYQQGPYQGQQPYQPGPPQQQYPQQPYNPYPQQPQPPQAPQMNLGDGQMRLDPNLSAGQRDLVIRIQQKSKAFAIGFVLGIPLTFGGAHYGITQAPIGFAGTAVGLGLVAFGVFALLQMQALKRQLRLITADAWRSPAAHLPSARKAATQAAYLNGLLALLSLGAAVWLLVKGAGWGAYGNSFGFGALLLGAFIPLGMGLAAAGTVPQLLQVIPAGAKVGQNLYSIILLLGAMVLYNGIKGFDLLPIAVGAVVVAICLGAIALLNQAARRMRGEST